MISNYDKILSLTVGLILIAGIVSPAAAQQGKVAPVPPNQLLMTNTVPDHTELGDAGGIPSTAQSINEAGALNSISGIGGFTDADMFKICITNFQAFSATTENMAAFDTQLFLFDSNGLGIYSNDDSVGGFALWSTLPAGDANSPTSNGIYYLAISTFNNEPQGAGGDIFVDGGFVNPRQINPPTGAGGPGPIIGWDIEDVPEPANYIISLTGAGGLGQCSVVGGESLSIDTTSLLLAGTQTNAVWIMSILAVIGSVTFGALYITTKRN